MIYFIQNDSDNSIKVGHSSNVSGRLQQLQTGNAGHLRLLGTADGNVGKEKSIHGQLRYYRIKGEWFYASPFVMEFITSIPSYTPYDLEVPKRKEMVFAQQGHTKDAKRMYHNSLVNLADSEHIDGDNIEYGWGKLDADTKDNWDKIATLFQGAIPGVS